MNIEGSCRVKFSEFIIANYFKNRSAIILGSAPSVVNAQAEYLSKFDIIVRVNYYEPFNECKRTNVYYSFFGRSILKVGERIAKWGRPDFLFFKYPFDFCWLRHTKGAEIAGKSGDFRFVQKSRQGEIAKNDYFVQTQANFISNFCAVGSIPTTGVSAILDVLRYQPKELHIAGFDFFKSKMHDVNKPWLPQEGQGHDFDSEEWLVDTLIANNLLFYPTRIRKDPLQK